MGSQDEWLPQLDDMLLLHLLRCIVRMELTPKN